MSNDPIEEYILDLVMEDIKKRLKGISTPVHNPFNPTVDIECASESESDSTSDSECDKIEREKKRRRAYWLANRDQINRRRRDRNRAIRQALVKAEMDKIKNSLKNSTSSKTKK